MAAKMTDLNMLLQAGINPKTGLPLKFGTDKAELHSNIKKLIRIRDEQTAINRYNWYNTGLNITSQEIERLLYYRYSLVFFYLEGQFYLMPYALDGSIDFYGRENFVHPVPIAAGNSDATNAQRDLLSKIRLKVQRGIMLDVKYDDIINSGVIVKDYTPQASVTSGIPRANLQDPIIDFEAKIIPYLRTALMNSTGTQAIQVQDSGEYNDVIEAANAFDDAAVNGTPLIPVAGKLNFNSINKGAVSSPQDYLMTMQGIDNLRESFYGTASGGLFTKKEHTNDSENSLNIPTDFPLTDGLKIRQDFCEIVNSIWPLGIWCEIAETAEGVDKNGDMVPDDSSAAGAGLERNRNAKEDTNNEPNKEI